MSRDDKPSDWTEKKPIDWGEVGGAVLGGFLVLAAVTFIVWIIGALITGIDSQHTTDEWQHINDDCVIYVSKVNDVWFTPGHDGPKIVTTYCKTKTEYLEGS